MLASLLWLLLFVATGLALVYHRVRLQTSTAVLGVLLLVYTIWGSGHWLWLIVLWLLFAALAALNAADLRRTYVTARLLKLYKNTLPPMSQTESEALEAGTVGWDGELFSGAPNWDKLLQTPPGMLTAEEQAFLDGPTERLCAMIDEWQITHELSDMPRELWDFLLQHGFFAMIIPKRYGGLELSPLATARVLVKLCSRSMSVGSTVGVTNSLGPAELLLVYGTQAQKDYYLPRLARGEELPCFALTSPRAGSDATAITDTGVVCKGTWQGEEVLGIRLNWDKRYITLAPVATVLGLAFKLYDPDRLLGGDKTDYGITAALVPTHLPGIRIGRRHFPLNAAFLNGPTQGSDVFVPLDAIIGGPERAGQGWKMLVQQLAVGRGITLPSTALGTAKAVLYGAGAYTRLRQQFGQPIGKFHGVGEALARMAGLTYIMNAGSDVVTGDINRGEKPAVATAILKYHSTEMARQIANDAMDVHGGKAIMLGRKNYVGRGYQSVPIGVTVEGSNILTRCLIIFGQGVIRCHPYLLDEMQAASHPDEKQALADFDRVLWQHVGHSLSNAARSFTMALTPVYFTPVPVRGRTRRFYQRITHFSAAFALAADVAMLTLGGRLKRMELLSGRLGDVLSSLYLASAVLKHYEDRGRHGADLPVVEWACRHLLHHAQEQMYGLLRNFPNRPMAWLLRALIFPLGRPFAPPSDALCQTVAELMLNPTDTRERITDGIYKAAAPNNPVGLLQQALERAAPMQALERKVHTAVRDGRIDAATPLTRIDAAERLGILTAAEAAQLRDFDAKLLDLLGVDDFAADELTRRGGAIAGPAPWNDPGNYGGNDRGENPI